MQINISSKPRGIALVIVMIVTITLGILAGGFAYSMKVETTLARNSNEDTELDWIGRSGIEVAKWVLTPSGQGMMQYDALNQKWAGGTGDTNHPAANWDLNNVEIGRGVASIKIVDLDRKFNINTITPGNTEILRQGLILIGVDAAESPKIISAIQDWMDPDDATQMGSTDTESSYYRTLDPPYEAKNGPIDDITELMLIKGISPMMFYGSGQYAANSRSRRVHSWVRGSGDEPVYPVGFVDLFSTLSAGMINVNTASATVLQLIPEVDEQLAQAIITARAGPDGQEGNEDDMPFRSVAELQRVPGMPPAVMGQFARYFNVRSSTFEVTVDARIGDCRRKYVGLLRRDGNRLVQICFYWK